MTPSTDCPERVPPNDSQGWLEREPTIDEREIVEWLKTRSLPDRILHIGVGNAMLFKEFGERVTLGLSRDGGEVAHAGRLGLTVILCNKYDVQSYRQDLNDSFDCIVDPNVRSYTCCTAHFVEFMYTMLAVLAPGGVLLTSKRGLEYLVPTTVKELAALCPAWTIRSHGPVVVMKPSLRTRLAWWWRARQKRT